MKVKRTRVSQALHEGSDFSSIQPSSPESASVPLAVQPEHVVQPEKEKIVYDY